MLASFERWIVSAVLAGCRCEDRIAAEPISRGGNLIRRRAQRGRGRAPHDVRAEFGINYCYIVQAVGSVGLVRSFDAAVSVSAETPD